MATRLGGVTPLRFENRTAACQQIENSSKCKLFRFSYDLKKSIPKQLYLLEGTGIEAWKCVSYENLAELSKTNPFLIFCDNLEILNFDHEKVKKLFTNLTNYFAKTEIELGVIQVRYTERD